MQEQLSSELTFGEKKRTDLHIKLYVMTCYFAVNVSSVCCHPGVMLILDALVEGN